MKSFIVLTAVLVLAFAQQSPMDFYTGCGDTKVCWGSPEGCLDDMSCDVGSAYARNAEGNFDFETYAMFEGVDDGLGWAATGFSRDDRMYDDTVIFCTVARGAELYWNIRDFTLPVGDNTGLTLNGNVLSQDGAIYCNVTRDAILTFLTPTQPPKEELNDLNTEPFFWLIASGKLRESDGIPLQHEVNAITEELVDFSA